MTKVSLIALFGILGNCSSMLSSLSFSPPFSLKGFSDQFIQQKKKKKTHRDAGKKAYNKITIHLTGYKGSPSFVRARRTITQLKV